MSLLAMSATLNVVLLIAALVLSAVLRGLSSQLHTALHDPLTSLPTRRLWTMIAPHYLRRWPNPAVIMVDVNHLKRVNDIHGHAYGDQLVHRFAMSLREHFGPRSFIARLGGDEFVILLDLQHNWRDHIITAARNSVVEVRGVHAGAAFGIARPSDLPPSTASAWYSVPTDSHREPSRLMHAADLALYRAKNQCRARGATTGIAFYSRLDGPVPDELDPHPPARARDFVAVLWLVTRRASRDPGTAPTSVPASNVPLGAHMPDGQKH